MNRFNKHILLLVLSFFFITNGISQAWTQKKGSSYSQLGYSSITGDAKYTNSGDFLRLVREVSDRTFQLYHEQGITDKLTVIADVPIKYVGTGNEIVSSGFSGDTLPAGNLFGLGNINLSALYGLKQKGKWVFSLKLSAMLNTARENQGVGLRTGVNAWGIAPSFHMGYGGNHFWSSFDLGVNIRSNDFSSQIFSTFKIGTKLKDHFHFIGELGALQSMNNGNSSDGTIRETGLYTNNLEYVAFNFKLGYEFKSSFTIWGSIGGGISGTDVLGAPALSVAISYKIKKSKK